MSDLEIDEYLRNQEGKAGVAGAAPAALDLAEILVAVPENATPSQLAALQAKAQQVLERARSGADFTALAAEFSSSASRTNGGQMGLRSGNDAWRSREVGFADFHVDDVAALGFERLGACQ